jgi:hypothetical protein
MIGDEEEIFDEKELDKIRVSKARTLRSKRKLYSSKRDSQRKTCKYTIKMYDCEYELLKDQAKQFNISLQRLLDFFLLDGFLKKDPRIIDFLDDCIKIQSQNFDKARGEIDRFSVLDLQTLIEKIERG